MLTIRGKFIIQRIIYLILSEATDTSRWKSVWTINQKLLKVTAQRTNRQNWIWKCRTWGWREHSGKPYSISDEKRRRSPMWPQHNVLHYNRSSKRPRMTLFTTSRSAVVRKQKEEKNLIRMPLLLHRPHNTFKVPDISSNLHTFEILKSLVDVFRLSLSRYWYADSFERLAIFRGVTLRATLLHLFISASQPCHKLFAVPRLSSMLFLSLLIILSIISKIIFH